MTPPHDPAPRGPDGAFADRPVARPRVVAETATPAASPRAGRQRERSDGGARLYEARLQWLAGVSHSLASSPDIADALDGVAQMAVPALGDWCLIDLAGDDKPARRVSCAHADPSQTEAERMLADLDPDEDGVPCGVCPALRTGSAVRTAEFGEAELARIRDPERRAVVRALGIRATIDTPLVVRGRVIGAITLLATRHDRTFDDEDLALAEELSYHVAVAVDNAQLHERARTADTAKAEFLAVMSHELRTPLQAILGFSDLLRSGIPEEVSPAVRERVERIHAASEHLLGLVEQLLTASRLAADRQVVHAEPVDLSVLAREIVLLVEPLAESMGLRFVAHVPTVSPPIVTDVGMLRQILYNLLANAVKFTERGELELAVKRSEAEATLEVRDTGIGIAPENLGRVFDDFWQADGSATGRRHGAGLGLGISRRLARLLGGDISVASAIGRGTTFTVALPNAYDPSRSPSAAR